jgi:hypothetical protein
MTDNQIAKYLEQITKHCKAGKANPTAAHTHLDAALVRAEHVLETLKRERPDVTGAPV